MVFNRETRIFESLLHARHNSLPHFIPHTSPQKDQGAVAEEMAQLGIIAGLCESRAHSLPIIPCRSLPEHKSMGCRLGEKLQLILMDCNLHVDCLILKTTKLLWYIMTPFFQEKLWLREDKQLVQDFTYLIRGGAGFQTNIFYPQSLPRSPICCASS